MVMTVIGCSIVQQMLIDEEYGCITVDVVGWLVCCLDVHWKDDRMIGLLMD